MSVEPEPVTTLSHDEADEVLYAETTKRQLVSEHRWYDRELIVFENTADPALGALLGFYYMKPKTEMQEGQDVFESSPVKVYRVVGRETVTTVYSVAAADVVT